MIPQLRPLVGTTRPLNTELWKVNAALAEAVKHGNIAEAKRLALQLDELEAPDVAAV